MLNWKISEKIEDNLESKYPGKSRVILQLLVNRGLSDAQEIDDFLHPKYENLHDPFKFRDMQKLVDRVKQSRDKSEKVFVYGDYDADGVCSSIILVETLHAIGIKNVDIYIPHREKEGYGLNKDSIKYISEQGAKLLITVDCGTSNVAEVKFAKDNNIDVIILDHHEEPSELPINVSAFLNPHLKGETYPFKNLAAVGVVFKVVQALTKSFDLGEAHSKWMLDLVAIATVADMMDLRDENRILVKYGLVVLNKTQRLGLQSLISLMGKSGAELGVYEIGYMIAPRLNAAGRIDHANSAYELLATKDSSLINELSASLSQTNTTRQSETARILKEALEQVQSQLKENKVLVAVGDNWSSGIVGLVSGRITEKYNRPSVVIAKTEKGLIGSGRSIPKFNITQALKKSSEFLLRFGGHEGACGFTLKSKDVLNDFSISLNKIAQEQLSDDDLVKTLSIDMELTFDKIDLNLAQNIEELAPFGMGNRAPKFVSFGVRVENISFVGEQKHIKLRLGQKGISLGAIAFGFSEEWRDKLNEGDLIDIVYEVSINEWNNRKNIDLKINDIKK